MPLFEFVCTTCEQPFEELVRNASAINEVKCPLCNSSKVKKKISTFATKASGSSSFNTRGGAASSCSVGGT